MMQNLFIRKEPYRFQIGLAGKIIQIESNYRRVYDQCEKYIIQDAKPDLWICPDPKSLEKIASDTARTQGEAQDWPPSRDQLESMAICEEIADKLIPSGLMLVHGAVVAREGLGYMITAPSGVGKTTRIMRWLEAFPDSVVVNGDKPVIQLSKSAPRAFGTPWCGKEGLSTNISVPLRAIFCLERADENHVDELRQAEAFRALLPQIYRPEDPDLSRKMLAMLRVLTEQVKVYRYRSTPTQESVRMAWEIAKPV